MDLFPRRNSDSWQKKAGCEHVKARHPACPNGSSNRLGFGLVDSRYVESAPTIAADTAFDATSLMNKEAVRELVNFNSENVYKRNYAR